MAERKETHTTPRQPPVKIPLAFDTALDGLLKIKPEKPTPPPSEAAEKPESAKKKPHTK